MILNFILPNQSQYFKEQRRAGQGFNTKIPERMISDKPVSRRSCLFFPIFAENLNNPFNTQ
jgi:hypothetical protein